MGAHIADRHEFVQSERFPHPRIDMFTCHSLQQVWIHIKEQFLIMPRRKMKYEILRHATLLSYPRNDKPDIVSIAAAGFYYSGNGDDVVCYSCGLLIRCLKGTDEPICMHKQISPTCEFLVRNIYVNKRFFAPKAIEVDLIGQFEQGHLHAQEETQNELSVQPDIQQPQELNHQRQHDGPIRRSQALQDEPPAVPNIIPRSSDDRNGEELADAYVEALRVHLRDSSANANSENVSEHPIRLMEDLNQISSERSAERLDTRNDGAVTNSEQPSQQNTNDNDNNDAFNFDKQNTDSSVMSQNPNDTEMPIQLQHTTNDDTAETGIINEQNKYQQYNMSVGKIIPNFMDMTFRKSNFTSIHSQIPNSNILEGEVARFFSLDRYKTRLASFKCWPINNPMTQEHLADAGFTYTGDGDVVKCDSCCVVLQEWKNDDDPWLEHVRHSPDCPYILKTFGSSLAMAVIQNNQEDLKYYRGLFRNRRERLLYLRSQSQEAVARIYISQTHTSGESEKRYTLQCHVCSGHAEDTRPLSCGHLICNDCIGEDTCPICGKITTK